MQFRKKHLNISCTKSQRRHELTTKPKLESLVFKHPPLFQRLYENIFVKYFYPFAHIPLQILPYLERTITFQNNFQPELGLLYHMYILHVKISARYISLNDSCNIVPCCRLILAKNVFQQYRYILSWIKSQIILNSKKLINQVQNKTKFHKDTSLFIDF